ncbi:MAG TPA: PP2C family protein-serine/threonine phosphatase [Roseiflexaceae bacterium]|nr:PP2C family protein-serine/threonine phosphatase [Roseiflexaceae bacterium]
MFHRQRPKPRPKTELPSDEAQRQAEIEQDLRLARDIQQGLLLEAVPRLAGWEISAVSLPARDLGGDLYDFLPLPQRQHGLMIGDVSGKGLPAALRMAVARTVFRHEARQGTPPGVALAGTNRGVLSEVPQGMVTMLYAILDPQSGWMQIANAGHNYPLLVNGSVQEIELSGLPLGVDFDSTYEECGTRLGHGDTIVFYTDGVVEATNANEEMYGYEQLAELLRRHGKRKPRALVATLLQELRAWSQTNQSDDITVVVVRRRLASIGAELRSVADDILGEERTAELWNTLDIPGDDASVTYWSDMLVNLLRTVQSQYGRGLARELQSQMRLALEEYREVPGAT